MKALEIKDRIEKALSAVLMYDVYLLQKDINERTVAHKLATYLQCTFPEYHVDCEYNGNILRDNGKKYINILKNKLQRLGIPIQEGEMTDREIVERRVYPDIIIHKRDSSENLCIIEIKKSTSKISCNYDKSKLKCYTSNDNSNDLNYYLGVFINFFTGVSEPTYELKWYWNGKEIQEEALAQLPDEE